MPQPILFKLQDGVVIEEIPLKVHTQAAESLPGKLPLGARVRVLGGKQRNLTATVADYHFNFWREFQGYYLDFDDTPSARAACFGQRWGTLSRWFCRPEGLEVVT